MKKLYLIIGLVLIASLCFAGRIQQYHMMIIGQEQGAAGEVYEDFTGYTEDTDTNNRLSQTATRATATGITKNERCFLYKLKGTNFFSGDWTIDFDWYIDAGDDGGLVYFYLADVQDDPRDIYDGTDAAHGFTLIYETTGPQARMRLFEFGSTPEEFYSDDWDVGSIDTTYYSRFVRDDDAGTYGTVYLGIYSTDALRDAGDGTDGDLDNLTLVLHDAKYDWDYIIMTAAYDASAATEITAYIENLELVSY